MKKGLILCSMVIMILASAMMLQAQELDLDDLKVQADAIFTGVAGMGVLGIMEILKRLLKTTGLGTIALSIVVSFGGTAFYLTQTAGFVLLKFIIISLLVAGIANGIFKSKKPNPVNH